MAKLINNSKSIWLLIISLILIGCGIYVLFNPMTALVASALAAGIIFILMGFGYLFDFRQCHSYMCLAIGILDIIVGVILLANLGITAVSMPIIFGLWCLFVGITQFVAALELKEEGSSFGNWLLAAGLVGIIFGLLIFFYPGFGAMTITFLMGSYLILYGAFELNRYIKS